MKFTRLTILHVLTLVFSIQLVTIGQQSNTFDKVGLKASDSIYASNLPKLTMPPEYKTRADLPYEHDNSLLPFFRPTFSQGAYWNCGQAAGTGYNFTYEINAQRGADGSLPENQYSPNFTFNFMNNGDGWGVSYFNSFEAIKACGNPNLEDYGELFNTGFRGWKSGYEIYENAMGNRITDIYGIDVSTPEGITTLKHWLIDHMDGSQYGGVANFYLTSFFSGLLSSDSPDSGLPVIYSCGTELAGHAMTITGYNDSIRYDINNDGKYTNDIDLNGDNIIDMKDWEYGGFKTQNSSTNYNGKGYIMYRTLALEYLNGGIWNQEAHVIKVDAEYEPVAKIRLKFTHNSRNKIKIIAGVSSNIEDNYPQHTIEFPIFNYQGGDHYMQGIDTIESQREMEVAFDISALYTYLTDAQPAKFFVQIAENDDDNYGQGEILYYSLITESGNEIACDHTPVNIANNAITTCQITHTPVFNKVKVTTDTLLQIETGINTTFSIEADGGYPPYNWSLVNNYALNPTSNSFDYIDNIKLEFENNYESHANVELPFGFPFYGDTLHNISVFLDGFIMFESIPYPYPYYVGEESIIKNMKVIAPFMSNLQLEEGKGDGVWISKNSNRIAIRWKTSCETSWEFDDVNFCLYLYPDGRIETHYGNMRYSDYVLWSAGISCGDKDNYTLNNRNQHIDELDNSGFRYSMTKYTPEEIVINNLGELNVQIDNPSVNYPIEVQVRDSKGIANRKMFNLSASDFRADFKINGDYNHVDYKELSSVHANITNRSNINAENVSLTFRTKSEYLILNDTVVELGTIPAGETIQINDIATFSFSPLVPDTYNASIQCNLVSSNGNLISNIDIIVDAPVLKLLTAEIIDDDNNKLYPGETAKIKLTIQNSGHARSSNMTSLLSAESENIYIPFESKELSQLNPGDTLSVTSTIAAKWTAPVGSNVTLKLGIFRDGVKFEEVTTQIRIGHIPVLIVDVSPGQKSGVIFHQLLNELELQNDLAESLSVNLEDYMSVFVCMGGLFNFNTLTPKHSEMLVNYLNMSGNLYLEGRSTWTTAGDLPIINMFSINSEQPSYYYPLDTIIGVSDKYTKNMLFTIDDPNPYINYFIHPVGNASTLLKTSNHDSSDVAIAFDAGNYKTVGSNIQYGSLVDHDSIGTKMNYLLGILDFFDLKKYMYVGMPEAESKNGSLSVKAYPNPANGEVTINLHNRFNRESTIRIINIQGKEVFQKLVPQTKTSNSYSFKWDCITSSGHKLPQGIYLIMYSSNSQTTIAKLIVK